MIFEDLQLNRNVRVEQWGQGQHSVSDGLINVIQNCPNIESLCIRGDAANGYAVTIKQHNTHTLRFTRFLRKIFITKLGGENSPFRSPR